MRFDRLRIAMPLLAAGVVLAAQVQPGPPKRLLSRLSSCRSATLVSLDPKLGAALGALVHDEQLAEYGLGTLGSGFFTHDPDCLAWVRGLVGPRATWALLDGSGALVASGQEGPRAAEVGDALARARILSPIVTLRAYLKNHPENQEARAEYITLLHPLACQRTLRALDLHPEAPRREENVNATRSPWTGSAPWLPQAWPQLSQEQDVVIWAGLAQELDRLFQDPAWIAAPLVLHGYLAEAHSPMMQAIYRRHLPRVEAALMACPRTNALWGLWIRLQGSLPTRPSSAFIQAIHPLPKALGGRGECPPTTVVGLLVADARRRKDWSAARDLLQSRFEMEYPPLEAPPAPGPGLSPGIQAVYANDAAETYKGLAEPLVEALVASGQESRALAVVQRLRQEPHLTNLDTRLRNLAHRLGRPDLATLWAR
jgi:hypothetical protein